MNPSDEANAMPTATGMGLKPNDTAVPIDMVPIRLTAAVCDVNSASNSADTQNTAMNTYSDGVPPIAVLMPLPIQSGKPVLYISPPIASPPPKSSSVPQSMPAIPSCQLRVILPFFKSTGRKNNNRPPTMAAMLTLNSLTSHETKASSSRRMPPLLSW